ncbi:MAG: alpha/beta hydrolase [Bradyrhizobium sp.]
MDIRVRGHRCVYDLVGHGPNITLLHSVGLSTRQGWRYQVPILAKRFKVLTFDFRGLGESERGSEPLSVATFVKDLSALLPMLGISQTVLMGISLGGFVAQAFAVAYPEVVSALILVSTASKIFSGASARRAERNEHIRRYGMRAVAGRQLESHFLPSFAAEKPTIMEWYKAHYLANDPANYIEIMNDLGEFDSTDLLAEISCPTLVVAGNSDVTSVAGNRPLDSAVALHQLIKQSELAVIEGAHHYPQIDQVDAFNTRVLGFLSRTKANPHQSGS